MIKEEEPEEMPYLGAVIYKDDKKAVNFEKLITLNVKPGFARLNQTYLLENGVNTIKKSLDWTNAFGLVIFEIYGSQEIKDIIWGIAENNKNYKTGTLTVKMHYEDGSEQIYIMERANIQGFSQDFSNNQTKFKIEFRGNRIGCNDKIKNKIIME